MDRTLNRVVGTLLRKWSDRIGGLTIEGFLEEVDEEGDNCPNAAGS